MPKKPRSPVKVDQPSPNPGAAKRVKGKQPEADSTKMVDELRKAPQYNRSHGFCSVKLSVCAMLCHFVFGNDIIKYIKKTLDIRNLDP